MVLIETSASHYQRQRQDRPSHNDFKSIFVADLNKVRKCIILKHKFGKIMTSRRERRTFWTYNASLLLRLLVVVFLFLVVPFAYNVAADAISHLTTDGPQSLSEGKRLFQEKVYDHAALYYWRAVLLQTNDPDKYSVDEAFQGFLGCYTIQDRTVDGFLFIATEVMARKQKDMALQYIDQALA
ncbi:MAG: hypothetical protein ACI8RD_006890 [Bacillariaceae sp.]